MKYVCEKCSKKFNDMNRAIDCEKSGLFISMLKQNKLFKELNASYNFIDIPGEENVVKMVFPDYDFSFVVTFNNENKSATLSVTYLEEYLEENRYYGGIFNRNVYMINGGVCTGSHHPTFLHYKDSDNMLNDIYLDLENVYYFYLNKMENELLEDINDIQNELICLENEIKEMHELILDLHNGILEKAEIMDNLYDLLKVLKTGRYNEK